MPHRITNSNLKQRGSRRGPWLTSLVMYSNCMRYVDEQGIRASELELLARTATNLNGMERWGYVAVAPDPDDRRPKPPRSHWLIRATAAGLAAREVWHPLFGEIENRWRDRFGPNEIGTLQNSLLQLITQLETNLPDCLPILGYGLLCKPPERRPTVAHRRTEISNDELSLVALLSKALLAFALEFESESDLSLAISANILRVLGEKSQRLRDIPSIAGLSKESVNVGLGILRKKHFIEEVPAEKGGRGKLIRLTSSGVAAQRAALDLIASLEQKWRTRYGANIFNSLRDSLEKIAGNGSAPSSPLFRGLTPYPDGWRATVPPVSTLPQFPMVLHRGGYPDGS